MRIEIEVDSVKMMRETLCLAESALNDWPVNVSQSTLRRVGSLIRELDKHRPLGPDGKHGDRHTATCGCTER